MRMRVSEIERMAAHRPAGYVEDVLDQGEIEGEWITFDEETLARLRAKYGRDVIPRQIPVSAEESARCRAICENCPGKHYRDENAYCADPVCGCVRADDRREPWINRQTVCKHWAEPLQTA